MTTCRIAYEERVEQQPVQVCRQVAVNQTVQALRTVEKRIPVTYTYRIPRTVVYRVPLDACNPITMTVAPSTTTIVTPAPATPAPAVEERSPSDTPRPALRPQDQVPGPIDESAPTTTNKPAAPPPAPAK